MTTAIFFVQGGLLTGFSVEGHSEYGEPGQDILCAAISSCVSYAEICLQDVLQLAPQVQVEEGLVSLHLPTPAEEMRAFAAQSIFIGLRAYFMELAEEYPQNLQVLDSD